MATHSSILAWRRPWTGEPGGLQSLGSQSRTQLSTRWAVGLAQCAPGAPAPSCVRGARLALPAAEPEGGCVLSAHAELCETSEAFLAVEL